MTKILKKINWQQVIFFLFNFLLFATPFIFTWVNDELFEFNKMLFVYSLTLLVIIAWLLRSISQKKIFIKTSVLDIPILLFLLSQLVSTVFSIHFRTSLLGYYSRLNGGLLSTITYTTLYYAFISNLEKKHIVPLLKTLFLSGLFISLYAILEHFGHSPSCLLISGHLDTNCWIQDVQSRVYATLGQPNWLAAYLITLIPVAASFLFYHKKNNSDFIYTGFCLLLTFFLAFALIFTKSRSGMLGLGVGVIFYFAVLLLKKFKVKKKTITLAIVIITVICISLLYLLPATSNLLNLKSSNSTASGSASSDIRAIVWKGAIKVWLRYPIFGSGVETFAYSYYRDRPMEHNLISEWNFLYNKAHNEFLNLLANSGIFGLGTYLFLLGSIFFLVFKNQKHLTAGSLSLGLLTGLLAMAVSNFFGFSTVTVNVLLFLFSAFLVVLLDQIKPLKIKFRLFHLIAFLILIVLSFSLLNSVKKTWLADYFFTKGKSLIQENQYSTGLLELQKAATVSPREALYYDELASTYSKIAVLLNENNESTASAEIAKKAVEASDYVMALNPKHLNFYKTRFKVFSNLGLINSNYLPQAKESLVRASSLAPTDPSMPYYLALINLQLQEKEEAQLNLEKALEMKPNYVEVILELAKLYEDLGENQKAKEKYQIFLNYFPNNEEVRSKANSL